MVPEETERIERLREIAKKAFDDGSHALSAELFVRRNGAWSVLEE